MNRVDVKADPAVRPDGKCARIGCAKLRHPERSSKYGGAEAERDPFCSTECARKFHGVAVAGVSASDTNSATLDPDDPRHGTVHAYTNLKCHCTRCRTVWRDYCREHNLAHRAGVAVA